MLTIAICEDETMYREELLNILHSIKTEGELCIHTYSSADDFLDELNTGSFDLVFMDIFMKGLNGVEATAKIRELNHDLPVVFTTTSTDFALDAYRLNVVKYLEKPIRKQDVLDAVKLARLASASRKQITLTISGKERSFAEDEIYYFEQQNHKVVLHLTDNRQVAFQSKLDSIAADLPDANFYRSHKSFLVNLANVTRIDPELRIFIMKDGSNPFIKREKLKEATLKLDDYLFSKLRKDM